MQMQLLVEATFRRYYRLDKDAPFGVVDPHERSKEMPPFALDPAFGLASQIKDLQHPQEQDWVRSLFKDAAAERWHHLVPLAGLQPHVDLSPRSQLNVGNGNAAHRVKPSCPSFLEVMQPKQVVRIGPIIYTASASDMANVCVYYACMFYIRPASAHLHRGAIIKKSGDRSKATGTAQNQVSCSD